MTVKAVKSFSGERFNMHAGEVLEVESTETVKELLHIGYLEDVSGSKEPPAPETVGEVPAEEEPAPETVEDSAPEQTEVKLNETKRGGSKSKHN